LENTMALTKEVEKSLYKIADSLMVELTVLDGVVSGSQEVEVSTDIPDLKFKLTIKAKKMFSYTQTGVLFHVVGNLYVLVAHNPDVHNPEGGVSSAYLVDGSKCEDGGIMTPPEKLVARKLSLRETVDNLGAAIVASYFRKNAGAWSPLALVK